MISLNAYNESSSMKEKRKGKLEWTKDFQQHSNLLRTDFHPRERMLNTCGRQPDPQICLTYKPLKRVGLAGLAWMGPVWSREMDPAQERVPGPRPAGRWRGRKESAGRSWVLLYRRLEEDPSLRWERRCPPTPQFQPWETLGRESSHPGLDFWPEVRWANKWGLF